MDIRSFFKPKPAKGADGKAAAEKRPAEGTSSAAAQGGEQGSERPAKKSKYFAPGSSAPSAADKPDKVAAAGKAKSPARGGGKKAGGGASGKAAGGGGGTARKAAGKRSVVIIDSDGDDDDFKVEDGGASEDDSADEDFKIDLTKGEESGEDDGGEDEVMEEADEDFKPRAKRGAGKSPKAASPTKAATAAKPASPTKAATAAKKTPPSTKAAPKPRKSTAKKPAEPVDPEKQAAMAAVEEAAEKLPEEKDLNFSLMSESGNVWVAGAAKDDTPPNWGTKEAPTGHPDCLFGKTFVISGVLDSLKREEAQHLIKRHGGRLTSAVSGKTSFMLVGQDTGHSKYREAKNRGTKLIDEDGLFSLIAASSTQGPTAEAQQAGIQQQQGDEPAGPSVAKAGSSQIKGPPQSALAALSASRPLAGTAPRPMAAGGGGGSSSAAGGRQETQLWVEKHKPKTSLELVGNTSLVATMREWLRNWDKVHLHGQEPSQAKGGGKPKDMSKKAIIISGPPGIGKTSSAVILCKELGFEAVQVNASDTRGKSDASALKGVGGKLANSLRELTTNAAIGLGLDGKRKRIALIMDEVDGMAGSADRGGVGDLIQQIHRSKVPIIAICNDKYSQKLKSLRNHCLELDFRKPTRPQIAKRMSEIARKEGLSMTDQTMEALVESANGDIRLVLGQLQMIRLRHSRLSYDDVRRGSGGGGMGASKDFEMSPFEAGRRLLAPEGASSSLHDQMDLVFQDMDLVPLLVQENYVNHRPRIASNEMERMRVLAKAADAISYGDVATRNVRQYQNWSSMPFAALMSSVYPSSYMRGAREVFGLYPTEPNFPRFTAWLGQNSSQNKQKRLLGELHSRMISSDAPAVDRTELRLYYLPALKPLLTQPLRDQEKEGIPEVVATMQQYCLARDDIEFVTDVTKFKTKGDWCDDPFKAVPAAVKSAFTRQFNQAGGRAKSSLQLEEVKFGRGKGKKTARGAAAGGASGGAEGSLKEGAEAEEEAAVVADEPEEEEEEEPDMQALKARDRLAKRGVELTLKQEGSGKAKRSGKASGGGRGSGRGSGKASGKASGGGRGSGRGRGKK